MLGSHQACDITFFDPLVEPLHASLSEEQGIGLFAPRRNTVRYGATIKW